MSEEETSKETVDTDEISPVELIDKVPSTVRALLASVISLNNDATYHEPSCPICASANRKQSEIFFKSHDAYAEDKDEKVKEFFDKRNEKYSIDAINNHMRNHMDRGEAELRKGEYMSKLEGLSSIKLSTLDFIDLYIAALNERILAVGELTPEGRMGRTKIEDLKTSSVVQLTKTMSALLQLRANMLGEMKGRGEIIIMPKEGFVKVFKSAMQKSKTKEEKDIVTYVLTNLSQLEQE